MSEKIYNKKKQLGISLLEVLLSLSIIAIILIMATRYFFVASNNNKTNTTISQVGALVAAAHAYKGATANYANLSIQTLAQAGQLANFPGFDDTNNSLLTLWGGSITIASSGDKSEFAEITVNLPDENKCQTILRAYPDASTGNVTSKCLKSQFTYTFP